MILESNDILGRRYQELTVPCFLAYSTVSVGDRGKHETPGVRPLETQCLPVLSISTDHTAIPGSQVTGNPKLFIEGQKPVLDNILGINLKSERLGLPWGLSGEKSTCQCRRHGFDLWSRKIPHAREQLSPRTATAEPAL